MKSAEVNGATVATDQTWRGRWGVNRRWSAEEVERLRTLLLTHRHKEIAIILGRTLTSVKSMITRLGFGQRHFWSPEEIQQLRDLYPVTRTEDLAAVFHKPVHKIHSAARRFAVKKDPEVLRSPQYGWGFQKGHPHGRAHQFPKGHVPANKGLRRPGWSAGRMRETQFKKGQRPRDWKPIGTITTDRDGYKHIKVREPRPGERNPGGCGRGYAWEFLHQHLWEKHHGPIPPKHAVVFKDGNRENCVIENLECISQGELAKRNAMWNRLPQELILAIAANGALKRKLRRLSNGKE